MISPKKREVRFRMVRMAEARRRLPQLTSSVEKDQSQAVELCRRDEPAVLLISHHRFAGLIRALSQRDSDENRRRSLLAWSVTDRWLGKAPAHLREAQLKELHHLSTKGLLSLFMANPDRPAIDSLLEAGVDRRILERLRKRQTVARAIMEAESDKLYDAAEHATSEIDLD